jgi:hypothetical protein
MHKVRALCLVALAIPALALLEQAQEPARQLSQPAPFIGTLTHVPVQNKCTSGQFQNPETHELFWQSKGVTVFNDGYEATHSLYQGAFHTKKEMQKQRRKAIAECLAWLTKKEDSP